VVPVDVVECQIVLAQDLMLWVYLENKTKQYLPGQYRPVTELAGLTLSLLYHSFVMLKVAIASRCQLLVVSNNMESQTIFHGEPTAIYDKDSL
jgi:hypothetical protein